MWKEEILTHERLMSLNSRCESTFWAKRVWDCRHLRELSCREQLGGFEASCLLSEVKMVTVPLNFFFFFFLLNTASTCKSFRLWSLDKLEFRANKWLEWLKRMLSKCISSVRSKMRWGRGGAHFVSLDTLFEADFILPLIQSQQYPTLSLDCSLRFEKLTGSYPFCFWVLLSF